MRFLLSAVLFVVISNTPAYAYLLSSQTIASRVSKTHGKGPYVVDQDVTFRTSADTLTLREHWVVSNAEHMRLKVLMSKTPGAQPDTVVYEALYHSGNRSSLNEKGNVANVPQPREFIESVFFARTAKTVIDDLVRTGAVPASMVRGRARFQPDSEERPHEALVRLARSNGVVTYAFGEPTPVNAAHPNPGAWIEQDAFVIRRIRFPSEAEISVERYSHSEGGLRFPLERSVTFGGKTAVIHLISAVGIQLATADRILAAPVDTQRQDHLPDIESVKEFYSRFR